MTRLQELEKVDKERKEIATQIDLIKFQLRNLESNSALLKSIRLQFAENIRILKNPLYIASLNEYRKIKTEFQTVTSRLHVMEIDISNHTIALERAEKMLFATNEKYATLFRNQDAPVIRGNFGGQK